MKRLVPAHLVLAFAADRSTSEPARMMKDLRDRYDTWNGTLAKPLWQPEKSDK
jgi:hypothetical protein